jgi:hypothetical protein
MFLIYCDFADFKKNIYPGLLYIYKSGRTGLTENNEKSMFLLCFIRDSIPVWRCTCDMDVPKLNLI